MTTIELARDYWIINPGCGCESFAVPESTFHRWKREHTTWHCPTCGDRRHFTGKTQEQKQLEQAQRELAEARAERRVARDEAEQRARQYRRIRNRIQNGVCPCCNRTFQNLARHMATQHPDRPAGERVRHLRHQYGLTQQELAEELGIHSAIYVSRYEVHGAAPAYAADKLTAWLEKEES